MTLTGYEFVDLLSTMLYQTFGHPIIATVILLSLLVVLMVMFRAPLTVILIIFIPVLIGFAVNTMYSNWLEIPGWTIALSGLVLAFLLTSFFYYIQRG